MPAARSLLETRRKTSEVAFIDKRVSEVKTITRRQVFRGKVTTRNPSSGEYRIDTGGGRSRWAKAVTSSELTGKSVLVTSASKIGQIAEMPGFA